MLRVYYITTIDQLRSMHSYALIVWSTLFFSLPFSPLTHSLFFFFFSLLLFLPFHLVPYLWFVLFSPPPCLWSLFFSLLFSPFFPEWIRCHGTWRKPRSKPSFRLSLWITTMRLRLLIHLLRPLHPLACLLLTPRLFLLHGPDSMMMVTTYRAPRLRRPCAVRP